MSESTIENSSLAVIGPRSVGAPKKNVIVADTLVARVISKLINESRKTQLEIAADAGFEQTNIITMLKSGRTKFPIRRTRDFANAVGCDPYWLLEIMLSEYLPEVLSIVEEKFGLSQTATNTNGSVDQIPMRQTGTASRSDEENLFCMDFYFVHTSGDKLFPIQIENEDTGMVSFRISEGGRKGNTKSSGMEIISIEEMKEYVFELGYSVRCSTLDKSRKGLFSPNGHSIREVVRLDV
jgi:hypothetical protein